METDTAEWAVDLRLVSEAEAVAADKHRMPGDKGLSPGLVSFLDAEPCQRVWF